MNGGWKPKKDHPWKVRTAAGVRSAARRARTLLATPIVLELLREEEKSNDRIELSELEQQIKEFFE